MSIRRTFINSVRTLLQTLNVGLIRHDQLESLREYQNDISTVLKLPKNILTQMLDLSDRSRAQLQQDLFVLAELSFKRQGFFVEFGATNGIDLSNTYLLEREFGWTGILAEPATRWHSDLAANRCSSRIEAKCVWRDSNTILTFNEVADTQFSTIHTYSSVDRNREQRTAGKLYDVQSISLLDLLAKHKAPKQIDYLSIDTEGSEYEILRAFDFTKYDFKIITCEHNFTSKRKDIFNLLTAAGYKRKFVGLSRWDDWYVRTKW